MLDVLGESRRRRVSITGLMGHRLENDRVERTWDDSIDFARRAEITLNLG
jgi:hypothetical protein